MYDFFIEVYRLQGSELQKVGYMYRLIPVGTTFNKFNRDPDFVFKVTCKQGYRLRLDHPITSYFIYL